MSPSWLAVLLILIALLSFFLGVWVSEHDWDDDQIATQIRQLWNKDDAPGGITRDRLNHAAIRIISASAYRVFKNYTFALDGRAYTWNDWKTMTVNLVDLFLLLQVNSDCPKGMMKLRSMLTQSGDSPYPAFPYARMDHVEGLAHTITDTAGKNNKAPPSAASWNPSANTWETPTLPLPFAPAVDGQPDRASVTAGKKTVNGADPPVTTSSSSPSSPNTAATQPTAARTGKTSGGGVGGHRHRRASVRTATAAARAELMAPRSRSSTPSDDEEAPLANIRFGDDRQMNAVREGGFQLTLQPAKPLEDENHSDSNNNDNNGNRDENSHNSHTTAREEAMAGTDNDWWRNKFFPALLDAFSCEWVNEPHRVEGCPRQYPVERAHVRYVPNDITTLIDSDEVVQKAWWASKNYIGSCEKYLEGPQKADDHDLSLYMPFLDVKTRTHYMADSTMRVAFPHWVGSMQWVLFHGLSNLVERAAAEAQPTLIAKMKSWLLSFVPVMPCPFCRRHFLDVVSINAMRGDLDDSPPQSSEADMYPLEWLYMTDSFQPTVHDRLATVQSAQSLSLFFWKLHNTVNSVVVLATGCRVSEEYDKESNAHVPCAYWPFSRRFQSTLSTGYTRWLEARKLAAPALRSLLQLDNKGLRSGIWRRNLTETPLDTMELEAVSKIQTAVQSLDQAIVKSRLLLDEYRVADVDFSMKEFQRVSQYLRSSLTPPPSDEVSHFVPFDLSLKSQSLRRCFKCVSSGDGPMDG